MIKIYFNNESINEDFYSGLSTNFELFVTSFQLGTTASNTYNLTIMKGALIKSKPLNTALNSALYEYSSQPTEVKIYDDTTLIATLVVDDITEDDYSYTYTLTDKMVNLDFYYDASQIFNNGSATLLQIALDICQKAGIELATQNFRGYNKNISWYDNRRTAREYIGYIAELNGGYAQIGADGRLYFIKQKTNSVATISTDDCEDFKIGDKKQITRVVFEEGTLKYEFGNETGNTLYLNSENVFITEKSEVEAIYNEIQGFTFYNFETSNCPVDLSIKAGNVITFTDMYGNNYPTIAGYELEFYGQWYGGYSLNIESTKQEETRLVGTETKVRNLSITVDRATNTITQAIEEISEQNQKISQVTQTVDELNSKISDVAEMTTSKESTNGVLIFEDINESEPVRVEIHPISSNISYMYPRSDLYPANNLFTTPRTLRFTNTTTNKIFDYELPADLLYCNGVYDEFILDYDSQTCLVNKRVGYNADGTTYKLTNERTVTYAYPKIELTDGDYKVELLNYSNVYLFARLMVKNIYTTQFATRAEVSSEINQTVDSITASVNKKLTNYSTTTEMNSAISVKANEISSSVANTYATKVELNSAKSEIKQTTDSITSTVSQVNNKVDTNTGNITTNTKNISTLQQTATSLQSQINSNDTDISKLTQTATNLQSQITSNDKDISTLNQTASSLSVEVGKKYNTSDFTNAKITAKINDGTSSVQISASKISLAGKNINLTSDNITIASNNFSVDKNGKITANSGTIGGWGMDSVHLWKIRDDDYIIELRSDRDIDQPVMLVWHKTNGYQWYVRPDGYMYAKNAHIEGYVQASSGTIGGWSITDGRLENNRYSSIGYRSGMQALDTEGSAAFYAGTSNSTGSIANESVTNFFVTQGGYLFCKNAKIIGNITANSGKIAGWTIDGEKLTAGDGSTTKVVVVQSPNNNNYWTFAAGGSSHSNYADCPFRVSKTGELYATNAHMTGSITASTISGGTISGTKITNGNNFTVDANGNMTCSNANVNGTITSNDATITGGNLNLGDSGQNDGLINIYERSSTNTYNKISSWGQTLYFKGKRMVYPTHINNAYDSNYGGIAYYFEDTAGKTTKIAPDEIITPIVYQTSKATDKEKFEKLENALDIIKEIEIYKYNLKGEAKNTKKHIGFVIGEQYKYSKDITSNENDGVDIYSFVSVCCKAIQELQDEIKILKGVNN